MSVMEVNDQATSFDDELDQEYNEAVENGFQGTKQEYLAVRDYT